VSLVFSAEGIPALQRAIAHWQRQIRDTRTQIASGRFPEHDANCRSYIGECKGWIRRLNGEIHSLRSARP
jgi:hypothetical protein